MKRKAKGGRRPSLRSIGVPPVAVGVPPVVEEESLGGRHQKVSRRSFFESAAVPPVAEQEPSGGHRHWSSLEFLQVPPVAEQEPSGGRLHKVSRMSSVGVPPPPVAEQESSGRRHNWPTRGRPKVRGRSALQSVTVPPVAEQEVSHKVSPQSVAVPQVAEQEPLGEHRHWSSPEFLAVPPVAEQEPSGGLHHKVSQQSSPQSVGVPPAQVAEQGPSGKRQRGRPRRSSLQSVAVPPPPVPVPEQEPSGGRPRRSSLQSVAVPPPPVPVPVPEQEPSGGRHHWSSLQSVAVPPAPVAAEQDPSGRRHHWPSRGRPKISRSSLQSVAVPPVAEQEPSGEHDHSEPAILSRQVKVTRQSSLRSIAVPPVVEQESSGGSDHSEPASLVRRKRGRGPTRNLKLAALGPGEKLQLDWDDSGRPVGPHASEFANHIGVVVRTEKNAPLEVASWDAMPIEKKEQCYDAVMEKFEFEELEKRQEYIMKDLGTKYRNYRCYLRKNHYKPYNSNKQRLENGPRSVSTNAWQWLVKYWSSNEFKEISIRNEANRRKQTTSHYGGTKSIAQVIHEHTIATGSPPSRVEVFKKTRTRKNGEAVHPEIGVILDQIEELSTQSQGGQPLTDEQIFRKILPDRPGRVMCMGKNVTPSEVYGGRREREGQQQEEVTSIRNKLESTETRLESTLTRLESAETQLGHTQATIDGLRGQISMLFSVIQRQGFNLDNGMQHTPRSSPSNSHGSSCD